MKLSSKQNMRTRIRGRYAELTNRIEARSSAGVTSFRASVGRSTFRRGVLDLITAFATLERGSILISDRSNWIRMTHPLESMVKPDPMPNLMRQSLPKIIVLGCSPRKGIILQHNAVKPFMSVVIPWESGVTEKALAWARAKTDGVDIERPERA